MSNTYRPLREGDTVRTDCGAVFAMREGMLFSELPLLSAVGIGNLVEVRNHEIVRVAGMTSHTVTYHDGGLLRFAYNDRGELIELSGQKVRVHIDKQGRMTVAARADIG